MPRSTRGQGLLLRDQEAAERQVGQARALERIDRIGGRGHQRLTAQIERRVQHGADAGAPLELADHAGLARIDRLPRARAPNSMRPAHRATTPSLTSRSAIFSSMFAGSLTRWLPTSRARMTLSTSASATSGPR